MSILKLVVPPALWQMGSTLKKRLVRSTTFFEYAPMGWDTRLPDDSGNEPFWSAFVPNEEVACAAMIARVRAGEPVFDSTGDRNHAVFGYVMALAARHRQPLTVLDYGGNLGDHYWIAQALVPGVKLDYHCKELPKSAEAGRRLSPEITWHTTDACFDSAYDLVMFSGSIQYLRDWQQVLGRASECARHYLFLGDVSTVRDAPTYVATHRSRGNTSLESQINRDELVRVVESGGLRLMREFPMGPHPPIANAPEQPASLGFLFERRQLQRSDA